MKTIMKVVIVAIALGGAYMMFGDGDFSFPTQQNVSTSTADPFGSTTSPDATQVFGKTYTLTAITTDKSDPAVAYGGTTEFTTICYKDNGSADVNDWTPIATGAGTASTDVLTIPVTAGAKVNGGLVEMYCDIDIGGDDDYYVDKERLIQDNSRISKVIFDDPNGDNVDGWVYNYNLIDISVANPNQLPTGSVFYILIDEGSLTVSDPTSQASVGQGSVTNVLKFKADMSAQGDGEAISRVQITLNGTEDDRWKINQSFFEIDGIGKVFLSEMSESCTTNCVYKHDISTTVEGAPIIFISKNGDTETSAHVTIESNLDASDEGICVELAIRTVDAQGAFTTSSADAEIAEGTNSAECTL